MSTFILSLLLIALVALGMLMSVRHNYEGFKGSGGGGVPDLTVAATTYPSIAQCQANPYVIGCPGYCAQNPDDKTNCIPTPDPNGALCALSPLARGCPQYCAQNASDIICFKPLGPGGQNRNPSGYGPWTPDAPNPDPYGPNYYPPGFDPNAGDYRREWRREYRRDDREEKESCGCPKNNCDQSCEDNGYIKMDEVPCYNCTLP